MAPPPASPVRPKSVQRRPLAPADPVHSAAALLLRLLPHDPALDDLALSTACDIERKLFADAIRDGRRLCHLLNILRPAKRPIPNKSPSQNISSFLATCSSLGVPKRFLFSQHDFLSLASDPHALLTVASSLISIVEFLHPKQSMSPSRVSSRAAASTPNLLRDRPLPSTPQHDHYDRFYEQDEDDSDPENYLLSTQSTPQSPPLPKPPPKSPLRKSLISSPSSRIPSVSIPKQPPKSPTGLLSWSRPVSNLRASLSASGSGSSVNLPSLVSGLGSAAVSAASIVSLRKTPTKTSPPTKSQSQPTPKTPSTPTKIKARTQSPPLSRTKTHSPPNLVLVQDSRRTKSPPTSPSPTPRSPTFPSAMTPSTPRSPTRIRSPTPTTSVPLSESPSRLRGSGINHQAHQAHHQHHQSLTGVTPAHHHPSHPNHTTTTPLTHTKSAQSIQSMTSALSEGTTVISAKSSLFDLGRPNGMNRRASGGLNGNYGTIRTVTTELTEPAIWDEEDSMKPDDFDEVIGIEEDDEVGGGDCWVEEVKVKLKMRESFKFPPLPVVMNGNGKQKQDLSRVNEVEEDESASGCERRGREREREKEREKERQKSPMNVYLGKGKFPDDFMDVFGRVAEVRKSVERERKEEKEEQEKQTPPEKDLPTTPTLREKESFPIPIQPTTRTRRTLTPIARSPPRSPGPIARSPTRSPVPPAASGSRALSASPSPKPIGIAPSPSPPRKLAIVGFTGDSGGSGSSGSGSAAAGTGTLSTTPNTTSAFPRRPTHWSRRSLDVPMRSCEPRGGESASTSSSPSPGGLLPRQTKQTKEASPDTRVPRRHSTSATRKPLMGSGSGVVSASPTGSGSGSGWSGGVKGSVPFPRTVSGESQTGGGRGFSPPPPHKIAIPTLGGRGTPSPTPRNSDPLSEIGVGGGLMAERRMTRERYQSNIEGTAAVRRRRPSSYDEVGLSAAIERGSQQQQQGGKPRLRSRFESMVNLSGGGGLSHASASVGDLLAARESVVSSEGGLASVLSVSTNGAGSRKLVVREDGKPSTSYQLGNCIGRGQFGSVYRALNENTGQMVAVKRIRLEGLKEEEVTQLMREVDLVKSLSHPSVVKYEGMVREEGMLNIVLEYAENGSLGQTLKSFGKLNEALVARYVVKILEGLHYLHTSNIVHCDLKAANILTTKNGNVKLTDFGVSLNLRAMERERGSAGTGAGAGAGRAVGERSGSNQSGSGEPHGNVAGTPNWMAPEVIELKGASTKSDIWSLGCTVVELLTGRPPYADVGNAMSVMFRIVEDPMPPLPEKCDALLGDFLIKCFNKNPALRPSAEELCEHPWLKKNWSAFKDLKAQDSIPWIRRVSADFQKPSDAIRYLSQLDITESPLSASPKDHHPHPLGMVGRPRTSASSAVGRPSDGEFSPREHSFVKTTFSKPMTCRVCLSDVKKTALICGQCSLISHSKCAPNAPPTCDLRAQLLLFAQYAEKGNPASVYSNPALVNKQNVALSDVAFVEHSRTSLDGLTSPPMLAAAEHPQQLHQMPPPPGAFKFMAAFKRSRSNLTSEPAAAAASTTSNNDEDGGGGGGGNGHAKMHRLIKRSFGALHPSSPSSLPSSSPLPPPPPLPRAPASAPALRPESLASCNSSLRSAATANESFSSRQNTGRRSEVSSPISGGSGGRSTGGGGGGGGVSFGDLKRRKSNSAVAVLETVPGSRPTTSGPRSEEVDGEEEYESVVDADVDETRVPGGFEPKKRKKGGSSGCMVQ